ncbi:hypothetical protein MAE02_67960 [Microvirga aerophila]|uniref:Uncharacterized protein n=1 Tax=Microvirga aerophila TaxID=670291 RepID=A0A512C4J1_9HYPH|nr:hypothetical protein MAE02_67960 [Microvirga aerophila]
MNNSNGIVERLDQAAGQASRPQHTAAMSPLLKKQSGLKPKWLLHMLTQQ